MDQMDLTAQCTLSRRSTAPQAYDRTLASRPLLSGTFHAIAVTVWIDPGIIAGWLPPGVRIPEPRRALHPLSIAWGWQQEVCAYPGGGRFPLPWRLNYAEIITAVPDLTLDSGSGFSDAGRVTYLPRLYMNSWRAVLMGRGVYGFRKAFARIEDGRGSFHAVNRHGEHLLSAIVVNEPVDSSVPSRDAGPFTLFDQPIVLNSAGGPVLGRFELEPVAKTVRPVSVDIDIRRRLLSHLPAIRKSFCGHTEEGNSAQQFSATWTLSRPLPACA